MIVVRLIGGLGNQLFQYALARKLSVHLDTKVVLDITPYKKYKLHKYGLDNFNICSKIISGREKIFWYFKKIILFDKIFCIISKKFRNAIYITEQQFNFDKKIFLDSKKDTYLDGYWQSEKYFLDIRKNLLGDLIVSKQIEGKNLELSKQINSVNSISLHVRRGDYVSNIKTAQVHGVCYLNYYYNAIDFLSKRIENPVLFIFSDDIEWVKENLETTLKCIYVENNSANFNYEDLRLMSLCKHNIIANSSFSWWGAWLNNNPDKIVVAPKKWFNDSSINTKDLLPDDWVKI
ncbi:MAG: alpha-1,2-fucosyltransferase [Candidatus Magasanikbacteria bacterium]